MNDNERGLYDKYYVVERGTTGPDPREYFVLNLTGDKFARLAATMYAAACQFEYPQLAADLRERVAALSGAAEVAAPTD